MSQPKGVPTIRFDASLYTIDERTILRLPRPLKKIQELWKAITPMARWEWVRWVNATVNRDTRKRRVEVTDEFALTLTARGLAS